MERTRGRSEGSPAKEKGEISPFEQSERYLFEKKKTDEEGETEKMRMSTAVSAVKVMESHQSSKLDTSGTAKAVISCFEKLGVSFDMDQMIRDPKQQMEMGGVPEEYLFGHAFHLYHLSSPDEIVSFEFQHNVCGRSIYAEGTVDAVLFLAKKIQQKADQRIYNMIDVLREGSMC